jgi:Glyoxalase/Bleomycin resistance protein/Dioxygenase superfamily
MVRRINRVLVAVRDLDEGGAAFAQTLGLGRGRRYDVPDVGAISEALPLGDAWVQLLQPVADGPVARFIQQHGQGIYGLGIEVASLADSRLRVEQCGRQAHPLRLGDNELLCLKREQLPGLTVWITESGSGPEPADTVSPYLGIWQATNLVEDRDGAAALYEGLFGRPQREQSFRQDSYGYLGRTLYYGVSPGADSLEIAQVHRTQTAMGRFWQRHGPSLYMVTVDTNDMAAVRRGLDERGVRYAAEPAAGYNVAYVHPSALAGCFVGIIQD